MNFSRPQFAGRVDEKVSETGRLRSKNVLVTAAGQGIGRAIAIACACEGASVIATDINEPAIAGLANQYTNIVPAKLDVTDAAAVADALAGLETDVLVNCAGMVANGTILDCDAGQWARSFDLNVNSMYHTVRALLPGMITRRNGSIINISSVASSIVGVPSRFAYGVTKAAVIGLTKSVAVDFVGQGIRCNAICPGTIQSPSLDDRINAFADPVEARRNFVNRQPMKRLGEASEVAALAVHLASDESAFTTGQTFIVDGGWTAM